MILLAADVASQGLVIAVGAALLTAFGLVTGVIYKLVDNTHDEINAMRSDLRKLTKTTSAGFDRLGGELNHLNREVGQLAVRLETMETSQPKGRARRPGAG